ncbi:MAG: purine-nucleoside phosphorylase [bacterium]|nr:purine-nucleoside phosphorylase [bacterium]
MRESEIISKAVSLLKSKGVDKVDAAIVLGSGLGSLADGVKEFFKIRYSDVEGFPVSTVEGHEGVLIYGELESKKVLVYKGRFHYYEGYSTREATLPLRVLKPLGVKVLILTNAAGGVVPSMKPGDIMLIRDHINLIPDNPLRGPNLEEFGPRFPSMHDAYDEELRKLAKQSALEEGVFLKEGVYVALQGPSLETPSEYLFVRAIGGDAVGMSTAPEVIVTRHMGIKVLAFSIITNVANPYAPSPATHEEVLQIANEAGKKLEKIIRRVVRSL